MDSQLGGRHLFLEKTVGKRSCIWKKVGTRFVYIYMFIYLCMHKHIYIYMYL